VFAAVSAAGGSTARPQRNGERAATSRHSAREAADPNSIQGRAQSVFPDDPISQLDKLAERNMPSRGTPGRRATTRDGRERQARFQNVAPLRVWEMSREQEMKGTAIRRVAVSSIAPAASPPQRPPRAS
jgi:hypothetical protein